MISLGDYSTDDYGNRGETEKQLIWIEFIAATFFIQITFMNMLIAIMSDIFAKVMETEEQSRMKARLELLQDLEGVLKFFRRGDEEANYLLVVKPKRL